MADLYGRKEIKESVILTACTLIVTQSVTWAFDAAKAKIEKKKEEEKKKESNG